MIEGPSPMGHEYVGVVEEVGREVTGIRPGQFVVGSFWASDNTCETCRAGYQSACVHRVPMGSLGSQAEYLRVPLADGTLVATPSLPEADLIPSYLAASDVLGPAGSPRSRPTPARARPSRSSATGRSGCSVCSRPSDSAPSGSSR
jgi:threonine dehydrogenase-like Zn-dependent dehydrogenase